MNEYIGKRCPFCRTAFGIGDEIVVCSACDMPHHKDCWVENQGCTTFGCLGTISAVGSRANSVTATQMIYEDTQSKSDFVFCTRCGTKNSASGAFCFHCGQKLVRIIR